MTRTEIAADRMSKPVSNGLDLTLRHITWYNGEEWLLEWCKPPNSAGRTQLVDWRTTYNKQAAVDCYNAAT